MSDTFNWENLPDIMDVRDALMRQADLKARLKVAKLELEIYQAELTREKPRDSTVKLIGIDAASREKLAEYFNRISEIEAALDTVDADVKFHVYRLESAKMIGYKTRL